MSDLTSPDLVPFKPFDPATSDLTEEAHNKALAAGALKLFGIALDLWPLMTGDEKNDVFKKHANGVVAAAKSALQDVEVSITKAEAAIAHVEQVKAAAEANLATVTAEKAALEEWLAAAESDVVAVAAVVDSTAPDPVVQVENTSGVASPSVAEGSGTIN